MIFPVTVPMDPRAAVGERHTRAQCPGFLQFSQMLSFAGQLSSHDEGFYHTTCNGLLELVFVSIFAIRLLGTSVGQLFLFCFRYNCSNGVTTQGFQ